MVVSMADSLWAGYESGDTVGKLVRDLIPHVIESQGHVAVTRVLHGDEYEEALHDKLVEEVAEMLEATGDQILDEAADVYEVLSALVGRHGYSMDDVRDAAATRRVARGGFTERLWLEAW
jgi:predicted house-cleaning noncanonical NTP pyrophosphatase (MazG superfamily)